MCERTIRYSFAITMETTGNIADYKVLYDQLHLQYDELEVRFADQEDRFAALTHQLAQMQKMIFGSRNERFVATDDNNPSSQLTLDLDAETIAACKLTAATKISYIGSVSV